MNSLFLLEAKTTLTFPELASGTRVVDRRVFQQGMNYSGPVDYEETEALGMKYIKFTAVIGGYRSQLVFYDYDPASRPEDEGDVSDSQPVRVSCNCPRYKILFKRANKLADAQIGHLVGEIDARDYGYPKREVNTENIPGACQHLIALYQHLVNTQRVWEEL